MSPELRLHGQINDSVEYYATAAGCRSAHQHFFQVAENELRFFAPGSELTLTPDEVIQTGIGGTFCTYMFGVEQPLADLTKPAIHNRLILLGAGYDQDGQLTISEQPRFRQPYEEIFRQGHAVNNFFFFVDGLSGHNNILKQQQILRKLGKPLKRLSQLNQRDDSLLAETLRTLLPEGCALFLIRLTNSKGRHFQQEFQNLYYRNRKISPSQLELLEELAENLHLAPYQQERIAIDVRYHHRDNYRIIDEYKKVLIEAYQQGRIDQAQHARLLRLKTLALRQEIPLDLLDALDRRLKPENGRIAREPEYLAITRDILHDLLQEKGLHNQDMAQILFAKQKARRHHDNGFEQMLLETGQLFDEHIRDGAPLSLLEDFSSIITFFDRYDTTLTQLSRIAFMENFHSSPDWLGSLLQNRQEFNKLDKSLFNRLFFDDILQSRYLGRYGRRKLECLQKGLEELGAGVSSVQRLQADLKILEREEHLYKTMFKSVRERVQRHYYRYDTRAEQEQIFQELNDELTTRGQLEQPLSAELFQAVIFDIKKEVLYLRQLLPEVVACENLALRDDFIANSGLDYFHIEELEREYLQLNGLDQELLQQLNSR